MKISPSILVLAFLFNVALVFIFGWNGLWFTPLIIGFVLWFTYRKKMNKSILLIYITAVTIALYLYKFLDFLF